MFQAVIKKFFGDNSSNFIKKYTSIVNHINAFEFDIQNLTNDELREKSLHLKSEIKNGKSLEDIMPIAFALARESSNRCLGMRHFDVQLLGGMALHFGNIAEMRTGEGKTLACTLAAYLNALTGNGVHVVSVNDYLVKRDYEWMAPLYENLGISVGCVLESMSIEDKAKNYKCDITYVNNSTLGFDYLRDNMQGDPEKMFFLDRNFNYCIVDEADSILIDEARTPLIISGPSVQNTDMYLKINSAILKLSKEDFTVSEEDKSVHLLDTGVDKIELHLKQKGIINGDLYSDKNHSIVNHINQALKAHKLFHKNKDYIVKDNAVLLIDEFTGRILSGRRYSEGLHQAIEAKEGVAIQKENQTLASITYQNLFRMYKKLSGMTGTAKTEEEEFSGIYNMKVISIPTNNKVTRIDLEDSVFLTKDDKNKAILELVKNSMEIGQPVLIGTASVEYSENLSNFFTKNKIIHEVLNAKNHEKEAKIITNAGKRGAITISTNMAGRGTDIKLGGNFEMMLQDALIHAKNEQEKNAIYEKMKHTYEAEKQEVLNAGGLFVIGAERYESRRVDDQLRGRSGRQGDAGKTQFLLSLEDDLLRIFGGDKIKNIVSKLGFKPNEAMNHSMLTTVIRYSQKRIESMNYDMRKNILKYDDVLNQQRIFMYNKRINILKTTDLMKQIIYVIEDLVECLHESCGVIQGQNLLHNQCFINKITEIFYQDVNENDENIKVNFENTKSASKYLFSVCENKINNDIIKHGNKGVMDVIGSIALTTLDELWREHLSSMKSLMDGIHLRSYGQKDPLNEYKIESYKNFDTIMNLFNSVLINRIMSFKIHD